jgi:hypothetical protein
MFGLKKVDFLFVVFYYAVGFFFDGVDGVENYCVDFKQRQYVQNC